MPSAAFNIGPLLPTSLIKNADCFLTELRMKTLWLYFFEKSAHKLKVRNTHKVASVRRIRTAETLINHSGRIVNFTVEPTGVA